MKIRSNTVDFKINGQWYGMSKRQRKAYRDELNKLRRRERRALNRMVEEMVAEELSGRSER